MYAYKMTRDGEVFATSIAAIDLAPHAGGTRLTFTEQSIFIEGADTPEMREDGTAWGLDQLHKHLEAQKASA